MAMENINACRDLTPKEKNRPLPPCPENWVNRELTEEELREGLKKGFIRDRRHNYRTDGLPPQGTDKHIDELK